MDHVDVDGLRIAYRRNGTGPALVLLHGGGCDSRVWRVGLESFADAFTVVAWDAPGCGGSADAPESLPPHEVQERLTFALRAADPDAAFEPATMPGLFSPAMPPDRADELAAIMSQARPSASRTMAHAMAEADLRDALPAIDVPTLVVHGEADQRSPFSVAQQLQRSIPHAQLVVLPGLGHECSLESATTVEAAVRAFLSIGRAQDGVIRP